MGIFDALLGGPKFNASKCKTALRLCVGRVKLLRNKKAHAVATLKREIGDLLNAGKEDSARVRVEAVLREEATLEAFEVLDLFCELLVVRLPLIESTKDLPADLKEAVATVVYAARRVADAIPELKEVRAQFAGKYGSQYVAACGEDATAGACGVSELAMRKLALAPPSAEARLEALRAVAAERARASTRRRWRRRRERRRWRRRRERRRRRHRAAHRRWRTRLRRATAPRSRTRGKPRRRRAPPPRRLPRRRTRRVAWRAETRARRRRLTPSARWA